MRVAHRTTGLTGTVTQEADTFLGQPGPWVHVNWDDGLRCWVLEESVCSPFTYLEEFDPETAIELLDLAQKVNEE